MLAGTTIAAGLAQTVPPTADKSFDAMTFAILAVALGVLLLLLGAVLMYLRQKVLQRSGQGSGGLDIDELQKLYDAGQLSREEFKRLRLVAMGGQLPAAAAKDKAAAKPDTPETPPDAAGPPPTDPPGGEEKPPPTA